MPLAFLGPGNLRFSRSQQRERCLSQEAFEASCAPAQEALSQLAPKATKVHLHRGPVAAAVRPSLPANRGSLFSPAWPGYSAELWPLGRAGVSRGFRFVRPASSSSNVGAGFQSRARNLNILVRFILTNNEQGIPRRQPVLQ